MDTGQGPPATRGDYVHGQCLSCSARLSGVVDHVVSDRLAVLTVATKSRGCMHGFTEDRLVLVDAVAVEYRAADIAASLTRFRVRAREQVTAIVAAIPDAGAEEEAAAIAVVAEHWIDALGEANPLTRDWLLTMVTSAVRDDLE